MSRSPTIDAARLEIILTELRLPAMKAMWSDIAAQSDKEGWPASRFLAALTEQEMADRADSGESGQGFRLIADTDSDRLRTAFR